MTETLYHSEGVLVRLNSLFTQVKGRLRDLLVALQLADVEVTTFDILFTFVYALLAMSFVYYQMPEALATRVPMSRTADTDTNEAMSLNSCDICVAYLEHAYPASRWSGSTTRKEQPNRSLLGSVASPAALFTYPRWYMLHMIVLPALKPFNSLGIAEPASNHL